MGQPPGTRNPFSERDIGACRNRIIVCASAQKGLVEGLEEFPGFAVYSRNLTARSTFGSRSIIMDIMKPMGRSAVSRQNFCQ
ncbi:MAG: hypothetical protein R3E82_08405 [Pseudomonadales bacterium]